MLTSGVNWKKVCPIFNFLKVLSASFPDLWDFMVLWCFSGENCEKTHVPQHKLLRNLQSEQVALPTQTISVGECILLPAFQHSAVCIWWENRHQQHQEYVLDVQ